MSYVRCRHPYVRPWDGYYEQCTSCGHLIELPPVMVVEEVVVVDPFFPVVVEDVVVDTFCDSYYDPFDNCGFDGDW